MKYEKQSISSGKIWNKKKRAFDTTMNDKWMIVMDRMVPPEPQMEGQYQFYVASGDIFDGFLFNHNNWMYLPGIDARNKK